MMHPDRDDDNVQISDAPDSGTEMRVGPPSSLQPAAQRSPQTADRFLSIVPGRIARTATRRTSSSRMGHGAAPAAKSSRVAVLRSIVAPPLPSHIVASAHLLRSLPGSGAGRCHQTGRGAPPPDALPDRRGRVLLPPRKLGSGRQSREGAELKLPCQACARPSARCPLPAARCLCPPV